MTAAKLPPTVDPKGRCGTNAGYLAHKARGESACQLCKDAVAADKRRRNEKDGGASARANSNRWNERNREAAAAKVQAWRDADPERARDANRRGSAKRRADPEKNARDKASAARTIQGYKDRTLDAVAADKARHHPDGLKRCGNKLGTSKRGCNEWLPVADFHNDMSNADGLDQLCKECRLSQTTGMPHWRVLVPLWEARGIDPTVCFYSGLPVQLGVRARDHVNPRERGGVNDWWNLVPCHPTVNSAKSDREPWAWVAANYPDALPRLRELFNPDYSPIIPIALEATA